MWISNKKWKELEKRVADLEKQVQDQPQEIIEIVSARLMERMTKSSLPHHWKD